MRIISWASIRRIACIIGFPILLILGAIFLRGCARQRIAAVESNLRSHISDIGSRDITRTTHLEGEILGNPWPAYLEALSAVPTSADAVEILSRLAEGELGEDLFKIEKIITEHSLCLDALYLGARNSRPTYPYDWIPTSTSFTFRLDTFRLQQLKYLCIWDSHLLFRKGMRRKAVEVLCNLALFGRDVGLCPDSSGERSGGRIILAVAAKLRTYLQSQALDSGELSSLESAMGHLDNAINDRSIPILVDLANMGICLLCEESSGKILAKGSQSRSRYDVRWGYSSSLRVSDTLLTAETWARRALSAERLDWKTAREEYNKIADEVGRWKEPIVRMALGSLDINRAISARIIRANVRLLRIGSRFLRTGEVLALNDPFGHKMAYLVSGMGGLKIWSVGENGENESGDEEGDGTTKDDIVLVIRKS